MTSSHTQLPPFLLSSWTVAWVNVFLGQGVQILLPPAWTVGVRNSGPSLAASAQESCPCRSQFWKLAACSSSSGRSCSLT